MKYGNVNKTRIIVFFMFLGLFAATFQIGSMSTVSEEEANAFMAEFEELVSDIDAFGIFTHNLTIALPMFIPGFGVIWGPLFCLVNRICFCLDSCNCPTISRYFTAFNPFFISIWIDGAHRVLVWNF